MRLHRNQDTALLAAALVLVAASAGSAETPASFDEAKRLAAERSVPLVVDFFTET